MFNVHLYCSTKSICIYISFITKHQCLLTKLLGDDALDAAFCCSVCWYAQSGGAVVRNSFC